MKHPIPMHDVVTFQSIAANRWQDQFRAFANIDFRAGREAVIGGALQGQTPGVLTIRNSTKAREIERTWRVKHRGRIYEIKEPPRLSIYRDHLEMIIEGKN